MSSEKKPLAEVIETVKTLPNVHIELCGTWLWITGNTYDNRKALKETGCMYSHKKQSWYYHEESYHKLSSRVFALDEIRDMFGSETITV